MGSFFSGIFGGAPKPAPAPTPVAAAPPEPEKKVKKAQLLALKATGSGGLTGEGNIGRKKILV